MRTLIALAVLATVLSPRAAHVEAQSLIHFLRDYRPAADTLIRVTAYADGVIKDAINGAGSFDGSGSMGLRLGLQEWVLQASISFSPGADTLSDAYARAVRDVPSGTTPAVTLEFVRPGLFQFESDEANTAWHMYGYGTYAQGTWLRSNIQPADTVPTDLEAQIWGLGAGIVHFVTGLREANEVGLSLGVGLYWRHVGGDAGRRESFLRETLADPGQDAFGVEIPIAITINRVTLSSHLYVRALGPKGELSGIGAVFGATLRGNLFQFDFRRDPT